MQRLAQTAAWSLLLPALAGEPALLGVGTRAMGVAVQHCCARQLHASGPWHRSTSEEAAPPQKPELPRQAVSLRNHGRRQHWCGQGSATAAAFVAATKAALAAANCFVVICPVPSLPLQLINRMLYRSRQRGFLELDLLIVRGGGAAGCWCAAMRRSCWAPQAHHACPPLRPTCHPLPPAGYVG